MSKCQKYFSTVATGFKASTFFHSFGKIEEFYWKYHWKMSKRQKKCFAATVSNFVLLLFQNFYFSIVIKTP